MKTRLTFALLVCFITTSAGQQPTNWAKNDTRELSASYMLRVAYNERGYMGARVDVAHKEGKDVYAVVPGPLYHVKELRFVGLTDTDVETIKQDAPKAGDVYSAARMNDWIKDARKKLDLKGGTLVWGVHYDHEHAQTILKVTSQKLGEEKPQLP